MTAPDNLLYEYAVVRLVPRIDREEFINIGLLMMNKRNKWLKGKIHLDRDRISALFPDFKINQLKNQCLLFEKNNLPSADLPVEEKYRWLTASKSAILQVSPSHPGILSDNNFSLDNNIKKESEESISQLMEKEFSRLFSILIL